MINRLFTHGNCSSLDGFASAHIFKKYLALGLGLTSAVQIGQLDPSDIETGRFEAQSGDIVLDLPKPKQDIFFWCDHHYTSEPKNKLPENHYWALKPSCAGYLIELAITAGLDPKAELLEFKEAVDIMDGALYTTEQLKSVYYPSDNYDNPSMLQRVHMISALIHTRNRQFNHHRFKDLLKGELGDTPVSVNNINISEIIETFKRQLKNYQKWRNWVDNFQRYEKSSECVIQDPRNSGPMIGSPDRFYSYLRFPESIYSIRISFHGNEARLSIGSNIFQQDRRKVNIGQLGVEISRQFGDGGAGGHQQTCGLTIPADSIDQALEEILAKFRE